MKHLKSLSGLTAGEIQEILSLSADSKQEFNNGRRPPLLQGRVLTLVFEKPSLRTRNSFEAAVMQLGGGSSFLSSKEAGFAGRESLPDIARVLSGYSDAIVLRTFSQADIDEFAAYSRCPVINGLSDERHPCQALTDLLTMQEAFGDLKNRKLVFVGDGNNVAASLAVATSLLQISLTVCTPPGYELNGNVTAELAKKYPTIQITHSNDPQQAVRGADVVYTDVWASMGQEAEAQQRNQIFAPYQVNAALMAKAPRDCKFMHDLPARRGLEVTDEVIDGPQSIVFQQAENRMHLAKGLLVWLLDGQERPEIDTLKHS